MPLALIVLLGAALAVSTLSSVLMTREVNENMTHGKQLSWWGPDTSEVYLQYLERYPGARLPFVAQSSFRLCLLLLVMALLFALFGDWP
jgi:hypothetical protein